MKRCIVPVFLLLGIALAKADIIPFDLSPPGTDKAVGLSPSNEVGTVIGSTGSGNEILGGITFDTTTRVLSLAVGYGSAAGFSDLTGRAAAMHIHCNAGPGTNARGEIRGQLIPVLKHAPTVTCPGAAALECTSTNGAKATVTVNVADQDGDALEVI